MLDTLQFIIMLSAERHGSTHLPTYTVRLDDQVLEKKSIPDFNSHDSFTVQFEVQLEPGPHTLYIEYDNPEKRGLLKIEDIYAGTSAGGFSLGQMVVTHSNGKSKVLKGKSQYALTFTSPFFYWTLFHSQI